MLKDFLEMFGFELFDVGRNDFFLRNNSLKPQQHKGQLICGDAIFFRNMDEQYVHDHLTDPNKLSRCLKILLVYYIYIIA